MIMQNSIGRFALSKTQGVKVLFCCLVALLLGVVCEARDLRYVSGSGNGEIVVSQAGTADLLVAARLADADSPAPLRALAVSYRSKAGDVRIVLSPDGLAVGDFGLRARLLSRDGDRQSWQFEAQRGEISEIAFADIDSRTGDVSYTNWSRFRTILEDFAHSREGSMVLAARDLITAELLANPVRPDPGKRSALIESNQGVQFWDCFADVLNGIAAGATMVAGCGTPVCGPYWKWCCGAGVAWYGSALIKIAENSDCIF